MNKWHLRHEVRLARKSRIAYAHRAFGSDYLPSVHNFFDIVADRDRKSQKNERESVSDHADSSKHG